LSRKVDIPDIVPEEVLVKTLKVALSRGGDFAEVFIEDSSSESLSLDDGRMKDVSFGRDKGAGVRVVKGDTSVYCYTEDLSEETLVAVARTAAAALAGPAGEIAMERLARRSAAYGRV